MRIGQSAGLYGLDRRRGLLRKPAPARGVQVSGVTSLVRGGIQSHYGIPGDNKRSATLPSLQREQHLPHNLAEHLALFQSLHALDGIVAQAGQLASAALQSGGKLLFCGNGGSAADSQHLAAELTGRFIQDRRPLAALALSTDTSALTCIANDYSFDEVFARQVQGLPRRRPFAGRDLDSATRAT